MTTPAPPRQARRSIGPGDAIALGIYLAVVLAVWPFLTRSQPNPDAVSYLSIADHWASGRWATAINGYWSPLISWLLAPAIWVGLPTLRAAEFLSILIGAFAMWRLIIVMRLLGIGSTIRSILVVGSVPFLVHSVLGRLLAPDLLMAACLLGYVGTLIDETVTDRTDERRRSIRAGCWAGAAFLAKTYALPFVLAHLAAWAVTRWWRRDTERETARVVGWCLGTMTAVVAMWALPLSLKYERPTISTTIGYHADVTAPGSLGNPFRWAGLLEPPNRYSVSGWEEPSLYPTEPVDPVESTTAATDDDSRRGRVERLASNAVDVAASGASLVGTVIAASIAAVIALADTLRRRRSSAGVVHVVTAAVVYAGGLLFLVVDRRYLFFVLLLSVAAAGWLVQRVVQPRVGRSRAVAVAAVIALVSVPLSVVGIVRADQRIDAADEIGRKFERTVSSGQRLASSSILLAEATGACFVIGCTYWGVPIHDGGDALVDELARSQIDLYLVADGDPRPPFPARSLGPGALDDSELFDVSEYRGDVAPR